LSADHSSDKKKSSGENEQEQSTRPLVQEQLRWGGSDKGRSYNGGKRFLRASQRGRKSRSKEESGSRVGNMKDALWGGNGEGKVNRGRVRSTAGMKKSGHKKVLGITKGRGD